jgi:hypothetical protein
LGNKKKIIIIIIINDETKIIIKNAWNGFDGN